MCPRTGEPAVPPTHPWDSRPASGRKKADGKSHKEALRALKRRDSDAVYRQLIADTNRHAPQR
jgi:hypothetical protein